MMYKSVPSFYLINMNTIFSYNANAKYSSTKDLKGGHNNLNFSLLDTYLDEKGPSVKFNSISLKIITL